MEQPVRYDDPERRPATGGGTPTGGPVGETVEALIDWLARLFFRIEQACTPHRGDRRGTRRAGREG